MSQDYPTRVKKWDVFEVAVEGPRDGNPFTDHSLKGIFTSKNQNAVVDGFYDGNGIYKVRFMPLYEEKYTFVLKGSFFSNTLSGAFYVGAPDEDVHGPVRVSDTYHFSYEDGTPFYPFGTTAYVWHLQDEQRKEETLNSLMEAGFNKLRFLVFPKHYDYNLEDPALFPYTGTPVDAAAVTEENFRSFTGKTEGNHFDYERLNPAYFQNLDSAVEALAARGIQAELVIMHPYDRWGFSSMTPEQDALYVKYLAARYSAYHNVWWALANEYDLMDKSQADWERLAQILVQKDLYHHLRSIHNCRLMYDHSRPWITHCSVQRIDLYKGAELTNELAERYGKPVVMDELGYEGNIQYGWGSLTGDEMVRRFWETALRGGYPGHGETFADEEGKLWWSHGGVLLGESWERIRLLKEILNQTPGHGLCADNSEWDSVTAVPASEWAQPVKSQYIYYYSFMRPSFRDFYIDDETEYLAEVIDTWNCLVRKAGIHKGHFRISLPARPYIAVRLRRPVKEDYLDSEDDESVLDLVVEEEPLIEIEEGYVEDIEAASEVEGQLNLFEDIEAEPEDEIEFEFITEETVPAEPEKTEEPEPEPEIEPEPVYVPSHSSAPKPDNSSSMELNMDEFDLRLPDDSDTELLDDVTSEKERTVSMSLTNSDLFKPGLDDIEEDELLDDVEYLEDDELPDTMSRDLKAINYDEPELLEDTLSDTLSDTDDGLQVTGTLNIGVNIRKY